MGTILMILGIALIVMGLILMLAVPVGGILGVLAGIAAVIYGRKYNKEKKTEKEIVVESMNTDIEEFKVAGYDYNFLADAVQEGVDDGETYEEAFKYVCGVSYEKDW